MSLSLSQKRIGAAVVLLFALVSAANHSFDWGIFGRLGKGIMIGSFILLFIYLSYLGPTPDEILQHRNDSANEKRGPASLRTWLYFLTLSIVAVLFFLMGPVQKILRGDQTSFNDWLNLIFIESMVVVSAVYIGYRIKHRKSRRSDEVA